MPRLSFDKGLLLGEVLVSHGFLDRQMLGETVRLQRLIRNAGLDPDIAVKALAEVHKTGNDIISVLTHLGWCPQKLVYISEIGRLLLEAEIVPPEEMILALAEAMRAHKPLGAALIAEGLITKTTLWSTLRALAIIEHNPASKAEVLKLLTECASNNTPLEMDDLEEVTGHKRREYIRLGELISTSGAFDEDHILTALEGSLEIGVPLGRYLVSKEMLTEDQLRQILDLQKLVTTAQLTPLQASGAAKKILRDGLTLPEAVKKVHEAANYARKKVES